MKRCAIIYTLPFKYSVRSNRLDLRFVGLFLEMYASRENFSRHANSNAMCLAWICINVFSL